MMCNDWVFILVAFPMILLVWVLVFVIVDSEILGGHFKRKMTEKFKQKDSV